MYGYASFMDLAYLIGYLFPPYKLNLCVYKYNSDVNKSLSSLILLLNASLFLCIVHALRATWSHSVISPV